MSSSHYIPRSDRGALAWMRAFCDHLSAAPSAFSISPADVEAIERAVNLFASAMAVTADPDRRTRVATINKCEARIGAQAICAQYAMMIKQSEGIDDGMKVAAGVRPKNLNRSPIPAPLTAPLLKLVAATAQRHTMNYSDTFSQRRARPYGVESLQLFIAIADEVVRDAEQARWYGQFKRNPIVVAFEHKDDCRKATYFGRWISRRGEVGPWSFPVSMAIVA